MHRPARSRPLRRRMTAKVCLRMAAVEAPTESALVPSGGVMSSILESFLDVPSVPFVLQRTNGTQKTNGTNGARSVATIHASVLESSHRGRQAGADAEPQRSAKQAASIRQRGFFHTERVACHEPDVLGVVLLGIV